MYEGASGNRVPLQRINVLEKGSSNQLASLIAFLVFERLVHGG
jgi:hypothetical protein